MTARAAYAAIVAALALGLALALAGCGGASSLGRPASAASAQSEAPVRLSPDQQPRPAGRTAAYRVAATSPEVRRRGPIAGLSCRRRTPRGDAAHLELYAKGLVIPVPAGIGIAPPWRRQGAYVRGGVCAYPLRTYEPTGLVVIDRSPRLRLGDLFAVWGQPLSRRALGRFHAPVRAYLDGRLWPGAPGRVPLTPHAEIVLEVGAFVAPHPRYLFPPGR